MARNYANKMIAAAEVATNLGTTVPIPTTERQARPLTRLSFEMCPMGHKQFQPPNAKRAP